MAALGLAVAGIGLLICRRGHRRYMGLLPDDDADDDCDYDRTGVWCAWPCAGRKGGGGDFFASYRPDAELPSPASPRVKAELHNEWEYTAAGLRWDDAAGRWRRATPAYEKAEAARSPEKATRAPKEFEADADIGEAELLSLSLAELKRHLNERGVVYSHALQKRELQQLLRLHRQ